VEPAREAEIIDLDAWRRELEQSFDHGSGAQHSVPVADPSPAPASPATQKATQTHEAAQAPDHRRRR
jgi:hypothetical protein